MNALQIFNYQDREVRTIIIDGDPWFVAKDVCEILGLGNHNEAISKLDEEEKGSEKVDTLGGAQYMATINEGGLYTLIIRSNKPEARPFRKWVTAEVIPRIRKTGSYVQPQTVEDLIIMQAQSVKELRSQVSQIAEQQSTIKESLQVANHRLDSLDMVNIEGTARQRLNAMVKKYAWQTGIGFNKAWDEFKKRFNLAYSANLELLITNYEHKTGLKATAPQYLAAVNRLEDGIRVADKMINQKGA